MNQERLEEARVTFQLVHRTTQEGDASHTLATIGCLVSQALLDINMNAIPAEAWQDDAHDALKALDRK